MEEKKTRKTYHKLNEQEKKEIKSLYMLDNSKTNIVKICNDYNITKRQVFNIAKNDTIKNELGCIQTSSEDFTKRLESIILLTLEKIEEKLQEGDKNTLSQLSTTLGILYDKSRLEKNLSTNNSSINIKIEIEK